MRLNGCFSLREPFPPDCLKIQVAYCHLGIALSFLGSLRDHMLSLDNILDKNRHLNHNLCFHYMNNKEFIVCFFRNIRDGHLFSSIAEEHNAYSGIRKGYTRKAVKVTLLQIYV